MSQCLFSRKNDSDNSSGSSVRFHKLDIKNGRSGTELFFKNCVSRFLRYNSISRNKNLVKNITMPLTKSNNTLRHSRVNLTEDYHMNIQEFE